MQTQESEVRSQETRVAQPPGSPTRASRGGVEPPSAVS
jgi:hypothetical protein